MLLRSAHSCSLHTLVASSTSRLARMCSCREVCRATSPRAHSLAWSLAQCCPLVMAHLFARSRPICGWAADYTLWFIHWPLTRSAVPNSHQQPSPPAATTDSHRIHRYHKPPTHQMMISPTNQGQPCLLRCCASRPIVSFWASALQSAHFMHLVAKCTRLLHVAPHCLVPSEMPDCAGGGDPRERPGRKPQVRD